MWRRAHVFLVFLAVGCSVYEDAQIANGGAGGATDQVTAGGDTTSSRGSGGEAGTDMGSVGSAPGAGGSVTNGGGGGSGGVATAGGPGAVVGSGGVGGAWGQGGAGGSGGATGSSGTGGTTGITDAGSDAGRDAGRDAAAVCQPGTCKRVFVSLNVPATSGRLGGTTAADAFCQTAANAAQLGGTWRAWLSDNASSPSTRFVHSTVPYRLLDGSLVANNWNSLTSGTIAHPIDIFEDGTPVPPSVVHEVWTGTNEIGRASCRERV